MRPKAEILAEVRDAAARGLREVQLLGQIVNHYQAPDDPACDFAALLEEVHAGGGHRADPVCQPAPAARDAPADRGDSRPPEGLQAPPPARPIGLVAGAQADAPPLHAGGLPGAGRPAARRGARDRAQHGHDRRLSRRDGQRTSTTRCRSPPASAFTACSRSSTRNARTLWRRSDTPTTSRRTEKTQRIVALQALQRDVQLELHAALVGQTLEVLADAGSRRRDTELSGRTTGNTVVNFPGEVSRIGTLVPVVIRRAGPYSLWGEVERPHAD